MISRFVCLHCLTNLDSDALILQARVWDLNDGQCLYVLHHPNSVSSACFSPNDCYIATSCMDSVTRVWTSNTGVLTHTLVNGTGMPGIGRVNFSPNGVWLSYYYYPNDLQNGMMNLARIDPPLARNKKER